MFDIGRLDGRREFAFGSALQRGSYRMLRFALWRCLAVCTVSPSDRKRAEAEVSRHLAAFGKNKRGPFDPAEGSDDLHFVHAYWELHTVSRSRLHGGKYARTFVAGLREIVREDRNAVSQYAGQITNPREPCADSRSCDVAACIDGKCPCMIRSPRRSLNESNA